MRNICPLQHVMPPHLGEIRRRRACATRLPSVEIVRQVAPQRRAQHFSTALPRCRGSRHCAKKRPRQTFPRRLSLERAGSCTQLTALTSTLLRLEICPVETKTTLLAVQTLADMILGSVTTTSLETAGSQLETATPHSSLPPSPA